MICGHTRRVRSIYDVRTAVELRLVVLLAVQQKNNRQNRSSSSSTRIIYIAPRKSTDITTIIAQQLEHACLRFFSVLVSKRGEGGEVVKALLLALLE